MGSESCRKAFLHTRTGDWNVDMQYFLFNQLGEIVCVGIYVECVCVVGGVMLSFKGQDCSTGEH